MCCDRAPCVGPSLCAVIVEGWAEVLGGLVAGKACPPPPPRPPDPQLASNGNSSLAKGTVIRQVLCSHCTATLPWGPQCGRGCTAEQAEACDNDR